MDMVKALETIMLVCFGAAWPASILKSWRSRTTKGKSLFFLLVVLSGYAAGIAKVLLTEGPTGFLLIPYGFNALMVSTDTAIYFKNASLDKASEKDKTR
ncbi:MAG: hypothetical protein LBT23_06000 [Synergistaceae bacterium]|jgi:hypothetical protein|nr:hypothetical protein [Synergistaceae bacterium]